MYLIISIPATNDYQKRDDQICRAMETRGFSWIGVASSSLGYRDLEFENQVYLDDDQIENMESDLKQLIDDTGLKIYIESE